MLTQCPNCQTTFRVTSEILRVADGQVRCGCCQTQFDALERLIEENDAGEIESGRYLRPPRSEPTTHNIEVEEPITHEDITLEGRHIEISGTYEVMGNAGRGEGQLRQEVTEEWVELDDLDGTAAAPQDEIDVADEFASANDQDSDRLEGDANEPEQYTADVEALHEDEPSTRSDVAPELDFLASRPQRAIAPIWRWLALPLVLLLAVQAIHHNRSTLARHPRLGAPLIDVYDALGLQLTPDWNLHAYEIRQWGVVSDPMTPGTLKVRAAITNLADFAQPYPLLKLVLEDRWGDQVRAREFAPADYLHPGAAPNRLLAPAQKTNATIAIVDPGPDAEGFRFDVCLPGKAGTVCAGEVPQG